jgi:hypothetical protein
MEQGTIQTISIEEARPAYPILWWRDRLEQRSLYKLPQEQIGIDIHYAKHYQCGIELRWFDGFPLKYLKGLLDILVLIGAYALQIPYNPENIASRSQEWNDVVYESLVFGSQARLNKHQQRKYLQILGMEHKDIGRIHDHVEWQSFFQRLIRVMDRQLKSRDVLEKMSPEFELIVLPNINQDQRSEQLSLFKKISR